VGVLPFPQISLYPSFPLTSSVCYCASASLHLGQFRSLFPPHLVKLFRECFPSLRSVLIGLDPSFPLISSACYCEYTSRPSDQSQFSFASCHMISMLLQECFPTLRSFLIILSLPPRQHAIARGLPFLRISFGPRLPSHLVKLLRACFPSL
jgi:hypothetical protein